MFDSNEGEVDLMMHSIDPLLQSQTENHKLMIGGIIPRPIAFVTTQSDTGIVNGAPFSFFNVVSSNPPMISLSIQREKGLRKATAQNIVSTKEFVVHITSERYIDKVNETAARYAPDVDEVSISGMKKVSSTKINPPGVEEAKIRLECVLKHILPLEDDKGVVSCDVVIGRIVQFHIADEVYERGKIKPHMLKPVSRLAGNDYAKLGELFTIEWPK